MNTNEKFSLFDLATLNPGVHIFKSMSAEIGSIRQISSSYEWEQPSYCFMNTTES